jgi:hypothetical protein
VCGLHIVSHASSGVSGRESTVKYICYSFHGGYDGRDQNLGSGERERLASSMEGLVEARAEPPPYKNKRAALWERPTLDRYEIQHMFLAISLNCWYHHLWMFDQTASSDDTVQVLPDAAALPDVTSSAVSRPPRPISHPVAVRCILPLALTDLAEPYLITGAGDIIRAYDVSSLEEPELIGEVDAHWHDVTALRLWVRKFVGSDGRTRVEPWVVSASLDGTIRKWRLSGT